MLLPGNDGNQTPDRGRQTLTGLIPSADRC